MGPVPSKQSQADPGSLHNRGPCTGPAGGLGQIATELVRAYEPEGVRLIGRSYRRWLEDLGRNLGHVRSLRILDDGGSVRMVGLRSPNRRSST
jgi:hypothetical protein